MNVKKIILGTAILLSMASVEAQSVVASWNIGSPIAANVKATLYSDSVLIISGSGDMANTSPYSTYINRIVTVVIGDSITSIGSNTFYGINSLTFVTIGNSVTTIGSNAFGYCYGLTFVSIGNSVTSIGGTAFHSCRNLTSVSIPNSVTSIGDHAFYACSSLQTVNYNAINCTSMGSGSSPMFGSCTAFTTLNIGDSVKIIPSYAFYNCSSLTSITCHTINPPTLGTESFHNVLYSTPIYIPCQSYNNYYYRWTNFTNFIANGSTLPVPVITQYGSILTSSSATGNQWYFNNTLISGAIGQSHYCTQNGQYSVAVTNIDGCSSTSASVSVTNLVSVKTYTISGKVTYNGSPLAGAAISCTNGFSAICNANGEYSIIVDSNATVSLTPNLSGYTFSPPSIICNNVVGNLSNQNFTAATTGSGGGGTATKYIIQGKVTYNGSPLAGAAISCTNGFSAICNANGEYSITVDSNATVSLTPNLSGYTFSPPSIICNNVVGNLSNQNFTAATAGSGGGGTAAKYIIQGKVTYNGNPLSNANITCTNGTWAATDANGIYKITVDNNATVVLTPNFSNYVFSPLYIICSNVTGNLSNQNFTVNTDGVAETHCNASLRVYPNPAKNELIVEIAGRFPNDGNMFEIFDVVGQNVGANIYVRPINAETITIDISHLASGMYFLKAGNRVVRFVKE